MCGIIALTGNNLENIGNNTVEAMLSSLSKRGPDDQDFVRRESLSGKGDCILGQTRLSIVDLSGGHQPMRDNSQPLTIVFNGEIYGYRDLRKNLEKKGHLFSTNSDTEIILKSYIEYGRDCPKYLDGMFAFAIWDEKKGELFLARDRFGKKPLYYTFCGKTFLAASELKAFWASNSIKGRVDPEALADFLRLSYIPPDKSVYSNIKVLLPAHAAVVKDGRIETWSYWNLKKNPKDITYEEARAEIRRLFEKAVDKRMVADVEIGSLLSGGLDSTLVTAYAQKFTNRPIKTFSVRYGNLIDELPYAKQASAKIGTDHHFLDAEIENPEDLREVIAYFDEPHADSSDFPQHMISRLAASKVKVALSGDGADELFMGYGWYQNYWHMPRYKPGRIFGNPFSIYKKSTEIFGKNERRRLLNFPVDSRENYENEMLRPALDNFDKINRRDLLVYLPGQLLTKIDRTSMMHSLEMRAPFLDTALAEFVYNLPLEYKLKKGQNKTILKEILAEIMPAEFVNRRKQGFGAPISEWLKTESIRQELESLIKNENHPIFKYLNHAFLSRIIRPPFSADRTESQKIWSIYCLAIWFELNQKYHE